MDIHICAKCGKIGDHWSVDLRSFSCELSVDGKKIVQYDENGNEKV